MGKMKREYESLAEQGLITGDGDINYKAMHGKLSNKLHDPYNLWDTDDKGDNRIDMDRLWEEL